MVNLTGLTKTLIEKELLSTARAHDLVEIAKRRNTTLFKILVTEGIVESKLIASICSKEYGIPYFDLDSLDLEHVPNFNIKSDEISNGNAVPIFARGASIFVAISDPSNLNILDIIKFQTSSNVEPIIVEDEKLVHIAQTVATKEELSSFDDIDDKRLEALDIAGGDDNEDITASSKDDAPIVRFVNKMLLDAINTDVSDIHFEPYEKNFRVRFREDGILREHAKPPANLGSRITTRIKVMARLDISERRVPQDGRFKMRLSKHRSIDFRVSTCPTMHGEKVVMRILDPTSVQIGIEALGFESFQEEIFLRHIQKAQGMVLTTGPTGSGKTVTLYTALQLLNDIKTNISTAEDPIEINLAGINQVNVNPKAGLEFSNILRAFLRQDPDIIMVGEIRDLETAEIAIKAAQTGHMVLSTLHTNSASETINRLINMGIPSFNLATSVSLIIAQRLARKLCERCKVVEEVPEAALLEMGFNKQDVAEKITIFRAEGCSFCQEGYKGRVGIFELMEITEAIGEIIMNGGNAIHIAQHAKEAGIWGLRQAGLHKVKKGVTTLEEINRITRE